MEYKTLKRIIWHDSFWILLHKVAEHAKLGFNTPCGDDIIRILFPRAHILSADYEEQ